MEITRDIDTARAALDSRRRQGRKIGLVPTMGYLHAGHLSLVEAARRDDTSVVVSIFVNPMQFGPHEDLDRYPRDEAGDLCKCREAGVELVFIPPTDVMHDTNAVTTVNVAELTDTLCGPCRPGHFTGVATIVAKLFNIITPDIAYFGRKDAQQLAVIRRMVRDLNMPIEIVGCPIVREPDGLAMSSRNTLLSPDERRRALVLYGALCVARDAHRRRPESGAGRAHENGCGRIQRCSERRGLRELREPGHVTAGRIDRRPSAGGAGGVDRPRHG